MKKNILENLLMFQNEDDVFSCDCFLFMNQKKGILLDCGNSVSLVKEIKSYCLENQILLDTVVLTHFHLDHIGRYQDFSNATFYASSYCAKYLNHVRVVEVMEEVHLDIEGLLSIIPMKSSHAKGELILRDNKNQVILLGDVLAPKQKKEYLCYYKSQIKELYSFLLLHQKEHFYDGHSKEELNIKPVLSHFEVIQKQHCDLYIE